MNWPPPPRKLMVLPFRISTGRELERTLSPRPPGGVHRLYRSQASDWDSHRTRSSRMLLRQALTSTRRFQASLAPAHHASPSSKEPAWLRLTLPVPPHF